MTPAERTSHLYWLMRRKWYDLSAASDFELMSRLWPFDKHKSVNFNHNNLEKTVNVGQIFFPSKLLHLAFHTWHVLAMYLSHVKYGLSGKQRPNCVDSCWVLRKIDFMWKCPILVPLSWFIVGVVFVYTWKNKWTMKANYFHRLLIPCAKTNKQL